MSSASGQRPRQRTSTSCGECRRRKQKCNQAKDRPCNNCARRYPPVACIYDSGISRGSPVERSLDEDGASHEDVSSDYRSCSQQYTPVPDAQYTDSSNAYYAAGQTSAANYWSQQQEPSCTNQYSTAASDTSCYTVVDTTASTRGKSFDAGYYATEFPPDSSPAAHQSGPWYSASGEPRASVKSHATYIAFDTPINISRCVGEAAYYSQNNAL
ncbi:hypothetical protein BJ878DRAFT_162726 [Calycina marina]|uniref:Zn(2)-C6 fungal-type domain-containing protein n=1 Tax=Calycina marina TaxID=1763456 RepID=A0A9P8CD25_9HELO|nr:hypothetical protein BJ878DRAFT_162726 [Calycina marina]